MGQSKTANLNRLIVTLFGLNSVLLDEGNKLVAPLGLTSARWQVLGALALSATPLSVPQIARIMGITRQGVQKQINLMLKNGLCSALDNPEHRRSKNYQLTQQGHEAFVQAMVLSDQWLEGISQEISLEEVTSAYLTLKKLQYALDHTLPKAVT